MRGWMIALPFVALFAWGQPVPAQRKAEAKRDALALARREGRLKVGEMAPDFSLKRPRSEERVTLSQFRGKRPVALVFGSYT